MRTQSPLQGILLRTAVAAALVFIAAGLRLWPLQGLGLRLAYLTFYPAVMIAALYGGLATGLLATTLSCLVIYFWHPSGQPFIKDSADWMGMAVFSLTGIMIASVAEAMYRARARAAREAELARQAAERAEEANRQTRQAMEALELRETALAEANLRLKELDRTKTEFFSNVSHELRTPLALILGPVDRLLKDGALDEEAHDKLLVAQRNARLLQRHVNDLLDISKLEAGRMALQYAPTDLATLARLAASHFDTLAADRKIRYAVRTPDTLPAQVDAEKVQRILLNLLSNAFKFTPDGGAISLSLEVRGTQARIGVQDNGPGIPPALREAIFERFRQVEGGAERRHGGTGLGLAIVREFTALHGGTVGVTDAPGGGALFLLDLPLSAPAGREVAVNTPVPSDEAAQQALDELQPTPAPLRPRRAGADADAPRILVVEDNPDMNAFLSENLGRMYRVASARDGAEGLASAIANPPDLILSDVMMPGMSGERMVEELRRHPGLDGVPIVMLTAKADDELRVRLLRHGVQDYIFKPFSMDEVLARVGNLLAERQRSGRQLRQSEERFRETFEQAAVGIAHVSPDGHWLRVNQKLCDIVGYSREELLRVTFQDITHGEDLNADMSLLHRVLAGEIDTYNMEKRYLRKDGSQLWINLTVALVRDARGEPDYFISVVEDIQARKSAEAALRESAAVLREAQRLAGVGNWHWDIATDTHVWSEEVYVLYGRDPTLPPAVYPEVSQYFTPESWARLAAAVEDGLARGVAYECDAEVVRPDGSRRWMTARGNATRDTDGRVIKLHGTVQDITERKLAEEEIRSLNTGLEKRVEERTTELKAAIQELDSFAYAVSHDLRAPLRAMSGFSQALLEDYGTTLPREGRAYLEEIDHASHNMGKLIDGLLQLSRSTRGELQWDRIDLSKMARGIRDELERQEPERLVDWQIEEGLTAHGDARTITSVLQNLLGNAWKYTAGSGKPQIRLFAEQDGMTRWFRITDNGAGFDMRHAEKLFKPFQRLHRQDEFPGIGIGLATVQRILHRHGGDIRAEGRIGFGATFSFTLPDSGGEATS